MTEIVLVILWIVFRCTDSSLVPFSANSLLVSSSSHHLTKVHDRPCGYGAFGDWEGYLPDYEMSLWFYYFCYRNVTGGLRTIVSTWCSGHGPKVRSRTVLPSPPATSTSAPSL